VDATAWVAVAGIIGTFASGIAGPALIERMRRESTRIEQVRAQRLAVYADLLKVTARLADNALTWSAIPPADLKETDSDELDAVISRARVVASENVYEHLGDLARQVQQFYVGLDEARTSQRRLAREGKVDDDTAIRQRMSLGGIADQILVAHKRITDAVRNEMTY
ncbi:hypothetical protein GS982_21480, partial [Rhodococcus hoagii]|nr:hypothetical protein [Prescottella equi]